MTAEFIAVTEVLDGAESWGWRVECTHPDCREFGAGFAVVALDREVAVGRGRRHVGEKHP